MDLEKLYVENGFPSLNRFYKILKEQKKYISIEKIKKFLEDKKVHQLNRKIKRPKKYNTIISHSILSNMQMDIMIYDRYEFNKYKYILNIVDVYSRYAFSFALTNREINNMINKLQTLFDKIGYPKNINCDNEFNTIAFNNFAKKNNINMYFSYPNEPNKNSIVERFNRTLADMLQRVRIGSGNYDWNNYLDEVVKTYNNMEHRTIQAKPIDIWNGEKEPKQKIIKLNMKYKIGDHVRIVLDKGVFNKGDNVQVSKTIYIIKGIEKNRYVISEGNTELERRYKEYELIKVTKIEEKKEEKENKDEIKHNEQVKEKKVKRRVKKEGIEINNVVERPKRITNPVYRDFFVN